jgi:hypothetical protein
VADESKPPYANLAAVLAGGYATVTAVLAFLGIKDAALDRMLREDHRAVVFFAAMVALGIILGIVAQQVTVPGSLNAVAVVVLAALPIVAFPFIADRARSVEVEDGSNLTLILLGVVVGALILMVVAGTFRMRTNGVLLVLGGVLFALGSYGGVRLAIESKSSFTSPEITVAKVTAAEGAPLVLDAAAAVDGLRDCHRLQLTVDGVVYGSSGGGADAKAEVAISIPLAALDASANELEVEAEVVPFDAVDALDEGASKDDLDAAEEEVAGCPSPRSGRAAKRSVPLPPANGQPSLSATVEADRRVAVSIDAANVEPGGRVLVVASDGTAACTLLADVELSPADGAVASTLPVAPLASSTSKGDRCAATMEDPAARMRISLPAAPKATPGTGP